MPTPPSAHQNDTVFIQGPTITIIWQDGRKETHPLNQEVVRIGRGEKDNEIAVPDAYPSVSRRHLEIRRMESGFQAADLGSTNGVYVNGVRIETGVTLQDGDEIWVGPDTVEDRVTVIFHMGMGGLLKDYVDLPQDTDKPAEMIFQVEIPEDCPYLAIRWPDGLVNYCPLRSEKTLLGRDPGCDMVFPYWMKFISNQHAVIQHNEYGFTITDLHSTNGTRLNNQLLEPGTAIPLKDGAIVRIGDEKFGISIGLTFHDFETVDQPVAGFSPAYVEPTMIVRHEGITIGRSENCDIRLLSPQVSRYHARINQVGETYWLEDLKSMNGTLVNNHLVRQQEIKNGDVITIGNHVLVFHEGQLSQFQNQGMRLDITGLTKDVKTRQGPLRILDHIDMTVLPREFIAIVGGSGAGKSTLMNAMIGSRPADGFVELNGHDFYLQYDHFRSQLGYVPQSDILHMSLTVEKALDFAARLRFPADVSAKERTKRISEVLETVSMNTETIRKTRISNLSGGQRKRVSIAAELLADPKLIFLDEATSGLDPGLEKKMMFTLRQMADEGRTVILITHATTNIVQTDHVAFISQGKLVYFGPSQEALPFFEIDDFADIYERIERHGETWQEVFQHKKTKHYQDYVLNRQQNKPSSSESRLPKIQFGFKDFIRQIFVLTERAFNVLMSDWFTLILMLLLFPLTATLQLMISTSNILVGNLSILADPVAAARTLLESYTPFADLNTFVFVMGLEAVLVGMYVPSNELIKERTVYLRERMVNLKVFPYLLSKLLVFTIFAAIQTFLYLIVLSFGVNLPKEGLFTAAPVELFITLFLTMLASMGIGFVVSAISRSSDMAIYILVILLFFQFFFSGTVFDLRESKVEPLSYLTATRWSLTALGVTIDMKEQVEATVLCNEMPDDPRTPENEAGRLQCFHYPDAADNLMLPYEDENLVRSWLVLLAMAFLTIMFTGFLIKRLDR